MVLYLTDGVPDIINLRKVLYSVVIFVRELPPQPLTCPVATGIKPPVTTNANANAERS